MIRQLFATGLLVASSISVWAQDGLGSDYQELKDWRKVDPAAWSAIRPGTHVQFGTADLRYDKLFAPKQPAWPQAGAATPGRTKRSTRNSLFTPPRPSRG